MKYCSENGKRLIHFSTCEVYGKTIGSFLPKDSPLRQVKFRFRFRFRELYSCLRAFLKCVIEEAFVGGFILKSL